MGDGQRGVKGCKEGGKEEACRFKSTGDNREDEKSMHGSMMEMCF